MSVLLVRHAVAKDRSRWEGRDELRPLTRRGRQQASELVDALAGYDIGRVLSSPSVRCLDTVAPLAEARRLKVERAGALAEGRSKQAIELVAGLLNAGADVALCSHGDVIPDVLRAFEFDLGAHPGCAKGSVWVLDPASTRATYLPPPA